MMYYTGTSFTPRRIAGCKLWVDTNRSDVTLNGGDVAQIDDLSGTSNHIIQGAASKQPLWVASGLNSKGVLRFDGSAHGMVTTNAIDLTGTDAVTLFLVYKPTTPASEKIVCEFSTNYNSQTDAFVVTEKPAGPSQGSNYGIRGDSGYNIATVDALDATARVDRIYFDTSQVKADENALFRDGTSTALAASGAQKENTNSFGNHKLNFGARNDGASVFLAMDLAAVILYDTRLSETNATFVERYLGTLYGITIS